MLGPELLRAAPPKQIIDPPQYSVAWLILAALCVIVILVLVMAVLRFSRAYVERSAYRQRPGEVEGLKAEFLRAVNDVDRRHAEGTIDARTGHHELTAVMRRFVRRTTGYDVTSQDVGTLLADERTREVGSLISELYEPDFAEASDARLDQSVQRAREVVRRWS